MALNGLLCADVPLRNYSLTHTHFYASAVCVVTNLINNFMAVTFAVKLAVFGKKRALQ